MIKINLLPQEMAGGRAAPGAAPASGSALVALILILVFGIDIVLGGYLFYTHSTSQQRLKDVEARAAAVEESLNEVQSEYNEVQLDMDRMERLIQVAQALDPEDRLLWSRKLNMMPLLIPQGVYLTQIRVTQSVSEVETDESIRRRNEWEKTRKGQPPPVDRVPVYQQTLHMDGVAYIDQGDENQRLAQIIQFHRNLVREEVKLPFDDEESRFLEGFVPNVRPSAVSASTVAGREVSVFTFTVNTKKMKIEAKAPERQTAAAN